MYQLVQQGKASQGEAKDAKKGQRYTFKAASYDTFVHHANGYN
jgi:hypothetical protein